MVRITNFYTNLRIITAVHSKIRRDSLSEPKIRRTEAKNEAKKIQLLTEF